MERHDDIARQKFGVRVKIRDTLRMKSDAQIPIKERREKYHEKLWK